MFPRDTEFPTSCHKALYFTAHLALCLTHYLGIVFSVLAAVVRLWDRKEDGLKRIFLSPEIVCYAISIPIYLHLLAHQSSHLGDWFRPNDLPTLLSAYLNSVSPLTLLPLIVPLALIPAKHQGKKNKIEGEQKGSFRPLVRVVILWFLVPLFLWIMSNCTKINLFTDRYFIPKDGALMILLSLWIYRIAKTSFSGSKVSIPLMIYFCLFGTALFALKVKRAHFSLSPSISYHQNLLLEGSEIDEAIGIYYQGDHLFFPNNYIHKSKKNRLLVDEPTYSTYESFNSSLAGKLSTRRKAHEKPFYLVTDGKNDPFSKTSGHRSIPKFTNERSDINVYYFEK